jgi:hypothetical protein
MKKVFSSTAWLLLGAAITASGFWGCGSDEAESSAAGGGFGGVAEGGAGQGGSSGKTGSSGHAGTAGRAGSGGTVAKAGSGGGSSQAGSGGSGGSLDAGDADGAVEGDPACLQPTSPLGRNLTVTWNGTPLDFSTGVVDADFYEDITSKYWYFDFKSADGKYGFELRSYLLVFDKCPVTYDLATAQDFRFVFYDNQTHDELASSIYPGGAGTVAFDGYDSHAWELSFTCAQCTLVQPESAPAGTAVLDGTLHWKK